MPYNTRRGSNVGVGVMRNQPLSNNFVSGGQQLPLHQVRPQQQQQQNRPQHQGGPPQQQGMQNNSNLVQQRQQQQHPPQQLQQQRPPQQLQQQHLPQQQQQQQPQQAPAAPTMGEMKAEEMMAGEEGEMVKKKPFGIRGGKISKKEKQRRRNIKLSKILQPKNAVMILNELVRSTSYTVTELQPPSQFQYQASVQIENETHTGYGNSKMEAKNNAAEAALKYIVKNRKPIKELTKDELDTDDKMEGIEDQTDASALPWQHVASFALFKLLNAWGEDPFQSRNSSPDGSIIQSQNKPAKKMPENAAYMNPLMLLNQMLPHAQFEELGRSGNPPNVTFTFKCTVDGKTFTGTGSNKKSAKKAAAFDVCYNVLAVKYPPEIYTPSA